MEHGSSCSRSREPTIHQKSLTQRWLVLRHRDADCFLARLQLHVLPALQVPLSLVSRRRGRRQLLPLIDQLARCVVLLLLGRRQLEQPKRLRWRIGQLPVVTLLPTATTPSAAPPGKKGRRNEMKEAKRW